MCSEVLAVSRNYLKVVSEPGLEIELVAFDPGTGLLDLEDLRSKISSETAAVYIENPTFLALIETLNADPKIHGILVQLPLPDHLDEQTITQSILPNMVSREVLIHITVLIAGHCILFDRVVKADTGPTVDIQLQPVRTQGNIMHKADALRIIRAQGDNAPHWCRCLNVIPYPA